MSSILKGLMRENGKRTIKSVADEIASYIGDDPSDSAIVDAVEGEAKIHGFDPADLFDAVYDHFRHYIDENLHKWFKEKWVRFGPDGKIRGDCARGSDSEGKPKCLPQSKAHNLGKTGRKYAASKKRREDPNPDRHGKAKNVATKKKSNEDISHLDEKWSAKYKSSINCSHPKGFSQKAHCAGKKKHNESIEMEMTCEDCGMCQTHGNHTRDTLDEACWKGYHKEGNKELFGKTVPNCVKNEGVAEGSEPDAYGRTGEEHECGACHGSGQEYGETCVTCGGKGWVKDEQGVAEEKCPHCGGELVSEEMINEKQDACYRKVKSRYKVWPSAYASGALVQCRKKGASNWGNGGKKNESSIMQGIVDEEWTHGHEHVDEINNHISANDQKIGYADGLKGIPRRKDNRIYKLGYIQGLAVVAKKRSPKMFELGYNDGMSSKPPASNNQYYIIGYNTGQIYTRVSNPYTDVSKNKPDKNVHYIDDIDEDYTGIESGPSTGPFTAEKTPAINPYGGMKDKKYRGAIGEGILSEMPDTSGPVGVQPGGRRTYRPKPAGTDMKKESSILKGLMREEESIKSNNPVGIPEDEEMNEDDDFDFDYSSPPPKKKKSTIYGPNTNQVKAFVRHTESMTPDQWNNVGDLVGRGYADRDDYVNDVFAASLAARRIDRKAYKKTDLLSFGASEQYHVRTAARAASWEIIGADAMHELGYPFVFLPMFGFDSPDDIPGAVDLEEVSATGQGGGSAGIGGGSMVGGPTTYEQEYGMFKKKGPRRVTAMTNEALDSQPYKYTFHQLYIDQFNYEFTTENNLHYETIIELMSFVPNSAVDVVFNMTDETGEHHIGIKNTGNARRVFATVIDIVKKYAASKKPTEIIFTASNKEPSRIRLYDAFIKRLDRELPDYEITPDNPKGYYVLKRKEGK